MKTLLELKMLKKKAQLGKDEELGFQIFCDDTINLGNEEKFNLLKEWLNNEQ